MTEVVTGGNSPGDINALLMWQQVRSMVLFRRELAFGALSC